MKVTISNLQFTVQKRGLPRKAKPVRGQSIFEVLVALAVSALIVIGIVILATNSIRNTTYSKNNSVANHYAQEAVEWLRGQKETSWPIFVTNVTTSDSKYCFDTLSWGGDNPTACGSSEFIPNTIFKREALFLCYVYVSGGTPPPSVPCSTAGVNNVSAEISVSWTDGQGNHTVKSKTELANWISL